MVRKNWILGIEPLAMDCLSLVPMKTGKPLLVNLGKGKSGSISLRVLKGVPAILF